MKLKNSTVSMSADVQYSKYEDSESIPTFTKVKIYVAYAGENRNGTHFSDDVMEAMAETVYGVPIVGEWKEDDFGGHGGKVVIDEESIEFIETTKPYGFVDPETPIEWEEVNGKDYLVVYGYLWTERYPESLKVLEGKNNQSMEIIIEEAEYNDEDDEDYILYITKAKFSALCILGEDVEPCFEDATIQQFSKQNAHEAFKEMYKAFFSSKAKEEWKEEVMDKYGNLFNLNEEEEEKEEETPEEDTSKEEEEEEKTEEETSEEEDEDKVSEDEEDEEDEEDFEDEEDEEDEKEDEPQEEDEEESEDNDEEESESEEDLEDEDEEEDKEDYKKKYEELLKEHKALKKELEELKSEKHEEDVFALKAKYSKALDSKIVDEITRQNISIKEMEGALAVAFANKHINKGNAPSKNFPTLGGLNNGQKDNVSKKYGYAGQLLEKIKEEK